MADDINDATPKKRRRKEGLRARQVRILALLAAEPEGWFPQKSIIREANVDFVWISNDLYGRVKPHSKELDLEATIALEEGNAPGGGYKSLVRLGYVVMDTLYVCGVWERIFQVTPEGIKKAKELGLID